MKVNLGGWDRFLRYFFGFLLTLWGTAGGPWWTWLGVYLIMTSAWGLCPIYSYFNIGTTHEEKRELE
jgi:hypothetical protein